MGLLAWGLRSGLGAVRAGTGRSQEAGRWGCWRQPWGTEGLPRADPGFRPQSPTLERLVGERQRQTPPQIPSGRVTGNGRPGALGPAGDRGPSLMATGTVGRCPFPPFSTTGLNKASEQREKGPLTLWTPEPGHQADPSDLSLPSDLSSKLSAALSGGLTSSARPWVAMPIQAALPIQGLDEDSERWQKDQGQVCLGLTNSPGS